MHSPKSARVAFGEHDHMLVQAMWQSMWLIAWGTVIFSAIRLAYFVGWMAGTEAAVG